MMRLGSVGIVVLLATRMAWSAVSFQPVDVYVDAGDEGLAAYQIEIVYDRNTTRIVGLEGGEADALKAAPYYSPAGLAGGRIVIASFVPSNAGDGKDVAAPSGLNRLLQRIAHPLQRTTLGASARTCSSRRSSQRL